MTEAPLPTLPPSIRARLRRIALALVVLLLAWMAASQLGQRPTSSAPLPQASDYRPPAMWPQAPPPPPPPPAANVPQRLQALEERIARLEAMPHEGNADAARLTSLETQMADMQQRLQKNAQALTATNLFHRMKEAITRGDAFRDEWDLLSALATDNPAIEAPLSALAPYADTGVPTLETLKTEFALAVPAALADETPTSVSSVMQSLIRIRKVGEAQKGSDDESVIARAEAMLERGGVVPALKELAALSPKASGRFAAWKEQAQSYATARKSLEALQPALQDTPLSP